MRRKLAPHKLLVATVLVLLYVVAGSVLRALGVPTWLSMVIFIGIYYALYPVERRRKGEVECWEEGLS